MKLANGVRWMEDRQEAWQIILFRPNKMIGQSHVIIKHVLSSKLGEFLLHFCLPHAY